ncbi:MAG: putative transport system permease protein [Acidobacteriota bacterium]|jgi:ABC-type lipoprotein release transport system permease subunit|nr:putative transport system permease protein [Acidobacteriota bacterium]
MKIRFRLRKRSDAPPVPDARLRLADGIRMACGQMLESRVFFLANVVAISVGILLIVVMLSISIGLASYIDQTLQKEAAAELIEVTFDPRAGNAAPLTAARVAAFSQIAGVREVTPVVTGVFGELVRGAREGVLVSVASTTGARDPELVRCDVLAGSLAAVGGESGLVVPLNVASDLGFHPPSTALGAPLTLRVTRGGEHGEERVDLRVAIVAVVRDTRFSRCYLPLRTMRRLSHWQGTPSVAVSALRDPATDSAAFVYDSALVYANTVDDVARIRKEIERSSYHTASILDAVRRYRQIKLIATVVLTALGVIALFTGSISIFNSAYAAVMRRFRELAIYKTYGATSGAIVGLVLAEALMTAMVAAVAGFGAGALTCILLQRAISSQVEAVLFPVDWRLAVAAFVTACLACVLASIGPALTAARMKPVEAMRIG